MLNLTRRDLFKLGAASTGLAASGLVTGKALAGSVKLAQAGKDFSPQTGKKRQAIPSSCWQCVTRDGIVGYVEDGRLVKIEGNPELPRTNGKLCAKGQAGVNVLYNPDRLLYPVKQGRACLLIKMASNSTATAAASLLSCSVKPGGRIYRGYQYWRGGFYRAVGESSVENLIHTFSTKPIFTVHNL